MTIPSGKLQIVKPFEIEPGEELSFVFDINVVRKGSEGGYNLLPVISESGVAGEDVEVEEIGSASGGNGDGSDDEDEEENDDGENGGPPDDPGNNSQSGDGQP